MEGITNAQSFGSGNVDCGNVTNSYNNNTITVTRTIAENKIFDEDNQIKQWLSPLEPRYRHQSVQANRVNGIGGWLLESDEFLEWSGSEEEPEQNVLFCYGDPGAGKTHIRLVRGLSPSDGHDHARS